MAQQAGVSVINTELVLEGGCIEVDGHGTAIITESCVLNDNRNPGMAKAQFEDLLMPLLGLEKIIWLPGVRGQDITDGHTDFYARFARPGVVLAGYEPDPAYADHDITKQHIAMLNSAIDAQGNSLDVVVLEAPSTIRPAYETSDFAAGYGGFYVCNGAVIMQEFGDAAADNAVQAALQQVFPDRDIVAINIDGIAAGGGSIHCATQQEPSIGS
nr:agmatine deiminase family protein [Leptothoe kymatousa]